jgi:hypothetical protein
MQLADIDEFWVVRASKLLDMGFNEGRQSNRMHDS